jgi:hypothetical protein
MAQPEHEHDVEVHIQSLKTNEKTHFKVPASATVDAVWSTASDEQHLNEPRADGDTFRCKDGTDLTARLATTLAQLEAEGVCPGRQFAIRGPSGGA